MGFTSRAVKLDSKNIRQAAGTTELALTLCTPKSAQEPTHQTIGSDVSDTSHVQTTLAVIKKGQLSAEDWDEIAHTDGIELYSPFLDRILSDTHCLCFLYYATLAGAELH